MQETAAAGGKAAPALELLDRPGVPFEERRRALADLARVNRLLFGNAPVVRALLPRLLGSGGPQRLLDVGTGAGETAARLAQAALARGLRVSVVGLDRHLAHLAVGRSRVPGQLRVVGEASALPFSDGAFDWSLSTLLFHHFDAADNRNILKEMRRVARRGAAVVDLRRGGVTTLLARLLLPLLGLARTARHDGLVSARRAYTLAEAASVASGEPLLELSRRFPCRFSLVVAGGRSPCLPRDP